MKEETKETGRSGRWRIGSIWKEGGREGEAKRNRRRKRMGEGGFGRM